MHSQFKNLVEHHKESTKTGVSALRVTMHRRVQEMVYKSCIERELDRCSLSKSSFQMKITFAFNLGLQNTLAVPQADGFHATPH